MQIRCRKFISKGLENQDKSLIICIDDDPKKTREKLNENMNETSSFYEENNFLRFIDAYSWSSLSPPENEKFAITGSLELNQLSLTLT